MTFLSQFLPAEVLANEALAITTTISSGANGTLQYANGSSGSTALPIGTAGQHLTVSVTGIPQWSTLAIDASTLTGTTLASAVVTSSLTSVGTLGSLTVTGTVSAGTFSGSGASLTAIPNTALTNSNITVTAGTGLSGGGTVALGGTVTLNNTGVTSVTGTANEIIASAATGAVTISLAAGATSGKKYESQTGITGTVVTLTIVAATPNSAGYAYVQVFKNGILQVEGQGVTVTNPTTLTFTSALVSTDEITVFQI